MADGVKVSTYHFVHQALHGYSDGHQQLALSVKLTPRDKKTLLILSDISAPGSVLDEQGYISGYPLTESGFFAIGRTWPAEEMPRPGCVWTHTLLIDFNDLATFDSLSSLLTIFKRPIDLKNYDSYSLPIKVMPTPYVQLPNSAEDWVRTVVTALYTRPKDRIVVKRKSLGIEEAVFSIWSQQWPRLRRNFRFCTLTSTDRSMEGASFDLQVLSNSKTNARSRFKNTVDAETVQEETESWLKEALTDIIHPDMSGLRSFLRKLGPDVGGGREAFSTLCRLHQCLESASNNPTSVNSAVTLLQTEPLLKLAKSAKSVTVNAAISNLEALNASSIDFLWENLDLAAKDSLQPVYPKLARIIWHRDPQQLVPFMNRAGHENSILEQALDTLDLRSLVTGLDTAPELLKIALIRRPELVAESFFWSHFDTNRYAFEAASEARLQASAIPVLLESGRSDSAGTASQYFGGRAILEGLSKTRHTELSVMQAWIKVAVTDLSEVAQFLGSEIEIPRIVLHSIAMELAPDALPNLNGADPWLTAWRNSTGEINKTDTLYMYAYFINRSLGYQSGSQSELFQLSFEAVHDAAASDNLPEKCWLILEPRLPQSIFWFSLDRCKRIRDGVTDAFVQRTLSPICFAKLTYDDALFQQLVANVAQTKKGRSYLKQVRQKLTEANDHSLQIRHQIINETL